MERLLERVLPKFSAQVKGAPAKDIAAIERIAGRPLPPYYRWFLERMGRSMGPFAYRSLDFSPKKILACYRKGTFGADSRFLMVAYDSDPLAPVHLAYDLDHPARDDARVTAYARGQADLGNDSSETLREMHAHRIFAMRIKAYPQRVSFVLSQRDQRSLPPRLTRVMNDLGFTSPIPTGGYSALFERADAALSASTTLDKEVPSSLGVNLAARDADEVRRLLQTIAGATGSEVDIDEWTPALS